MKAKHFFQFFLLFVLLTSVLAACSDGGDDASSNGYNEGVFVVNEGPFNGTGTITWYDPETGMAEQDIFGAANNGAALGQFVQSISFRGTTGYVVVNGANRVVVVDGTTFRQTGTIEGLQQPRYFLAINDDFAYVTQWGSDGLTGSVAKVDLRSLQVVKTIPTGKGPEKMLRQGDEIYVVNSGGFGLDSTVSVINAVTDTEVRKIALNQYNPASVALGNISASNQVYVLARGDWNSPNQQGRLESVTSTSVNLQVAKGGDDLCAAPAGQRLYFVAQSAVWELNNTSGVTKLFDQNAYGMGCDPFEGNLYVTDPKGFSGAGKVFVYTPGGVAIDSFPAGVAPGEVHFRF